MKESIKRSKVLLKPLDTSDFKSKNDVLDYQDYEEQLSSYQKQRKKADISDLFDWTKPNELVAFNRLPRQVQPPRQQQAIENHSLNTQQLLQSEEDERERALQSEIELDDSIQIEPPCLDPRPYAEQVKNDYGVEYKLVSQIKLENDLKEMRERIIQMNVALNKMLDKYELMAVRQQKQDVQISNPYKFLGKQIQVNNKLLEKQKRHIKRLEDKDKELQKKDCLVQLTELIIEIKKEIHDLEKEKHDQLVGVDKINKIIKQVEQAQEEGDEFREIKQLKHQIVFYFKKLNEQKLTSEQLDQDMHQLQQKQAAMSRKLDSMTRVATEKYLQVSSNRPYVQLKKKYDDLLQLSESHRKKRQILVRGLKASQEKLQKQNKALKRQIQQCQLQTQQIQYSALEYDQESKEMLDKNKMLTRELKSVSYRFDQSLIRPEKGKFKPDFKRVLSRMESSKNKTIDASLRDKVRQSMSINDKNGFTYEIQEMVENGEISEAAQSRMKPILRSWKGKKETPRYLQSPQKFKTIESSNIFKPSLLYRSRR